LRLAFPKVVEGDSSDIAAILSLPKIGAIRPGRTTSGDGWDQDTYEDFARKVKRANPDMVFTKAVMDAAFRKAVSRMAPNVLTRKSRITDVLARVSNGYMQIWSRPFC
jgi:hypothetical protein